MDTKISNQEIRESFLLSLLLQTLDVDTQELRTKLEASIDQIDKDTLASALMIVKKIRYPDAQLPDYQYFQNAANQILQDHK